MSERSREWLIHGESEDRDCDELICEGEVNQESIRREGDSYLKERWFVMSKIQMVGNNGRGAASTQNNVDWTEIRIVRG